MFFKTMEIQGFKSFADKTVLNFDKKMTAIVGSNGNGKSNISDALRWVMGEQGAKTLRGDKMEDVIFHGTMARKPMGYARVALTVDNTDRTLGVDADEVTIERKLYRTGDSEYIINDKKCRLKDIQELLMGTGLGRDGYSVIGQGRVSEIINSKVNQRRELFEEAVGVSYFLHKKQEAERDLARADDNINRLKDIESELSARIPVLERQSEKARQAMALMEKEKALDLGLSVWDLDRIARELAETEDQMLANQGQCEHYQREIGELERESEDIAERKMSIAAQQENLRREGEQARDLLAAADREQAVLENEIAHCNEKIRQTETRIKEGEQGAEELQKQIGTYAAQIGEKNAELAKNRQKAQELGAGLSAMNGESDQLDGEYRELDKKQGELLAQKAELTLKIQSSRQNIEDIKARLADSDESFRSTEEKIGEYREKRREISAKLEENAEKRAEAENKLGGYTKLFESKNNRLKEQEQSFRQLQNDYTQSRQRLEVLSDVEKNMAGYAASVKAVVTAGRQGKIGGVEGTVADAIKVDKRYAVAVETALGAALQNVIVNNEETAKRCIRYLKETGGGRATFLPLTSVKGSLMDAGGVENEEGFEGVASELVDCDEKFRGIVRFVLGRCVIIEDIDTATVIAKKNGYKFKIVTLDGQVINAGGSFTGGSVSKSAGIITRNREIEELKEKTAVLSEKLKTEQESFNRLREEVGKMSIEMEGFKEQAEDCAKEEIGLKAELGGVKEMIEQAEAQQENAEGFLQRSRADIKKQEDAIRDCEESLAQCEKEIETIAAEIQRAGEKMQARLEEKNRIGEEITALGMEGLSINKDIERIQGLKASAEESLEQLSKGSDSLQAEISAEEQRIEEIKLQIEEKKKQAEELKNSFKGGSDKVAQLISQTNDLEKRLTEINREIREKSEAKEKFSAALAVNTERKAAFEKETERIKASLWEKYELAPSEAAKQAEIPQDVKSARGQLAELRRQISALGNVNFASIDEFKEVSDRHRELKGQLDDVERSKRELEKLIENLTVDIKARFLEGFNSINDHFKRIFTEIFGGGSAHLELTDPEDILNSGIEIFAAPPGKLIKNLISLSGGEQTMVAITIYFAILLHRPTPFCMLDEVDAALDEVNVVKYITYLKRFSGSTQLMVITHRRGTIEGCDVLYGVFMQEKGVSRLLRQEIIDDLDIELE
ncbi:MAG: chromosome segregation protein SMC [Firmicutes bacterium]|nr:chromosome segregation protein SMC [[Eubacterium] siraeum]MCM1487035.1 chromosome segregation protein SMC [Bacillota bacterium]